jgi:rSAM/selenodomain-associated transferase 2
MPAPLSIVIPALNAEAGLPETLSALVPGSVSGLVREVVVSDGGSSDNTRDIAEGTGARIVTGSKGRGVQLRAGASAAKGEWLLFLHADTALEAGWDKEVSRFMERADQQGGMQAAAFTFALDDFSSQARRVERLVGWRCRTLGLPYGDQGLLISRKFYDALAGYGDMPLMEDVDLVRRIGKKRLTVLKTRAVTSAQRFRQDGWWLRPLRNICLVALFYCKVPPRLLIKLYG